MNILHDQLLLFAFVIVMSYCNPFLLHKFAKLLEISTNPSRVQRFSMFSCKLHSFPIADRTIIDIPRSRLNITHRSKVLFIGSCFSEVISYHMKQQKFNVLANPFGIVFNPISISNTIERCLLSDDFSDNDILVDSHEKSLYHSWNHHGRFSSTDKNQMLFHMNQTKNEAYEYIKAMDVLIITLGTAFIHRLKSTNEIVANCHKQPPSLFQKHMLDMKLIISTLSATVARCREVNPKVKVIFTVSPVRHTKEGISENSLSKSTLLCAVHKLIELYPDFISYFPSYEIMMDELRDYRWYADDMIHPSSIAENIIFQRFKDTYCDSATISLADSISKIIKRIEHRPIVSSSTTYQKHLHDTIRIIANLEAKHPYISMADEKKQLDMALAKSLDS